MVDFTAAQFFNNIYITPHDRNTGIENETIYVYDGTRCRPVGGAAPAGSIAATVSNLSGHVEAGIHIFAISYETDTGYITKPGPVIYATVTAPGNRQIDITGIPIGPTGTVARRILTTRRIDPAKYTGNQDGYEFYFVPTGRLADNTTITATVDFYDADLLATADYLFDQLGTIPAGVGITTYQNSLVVWGEYGEPSTVRISKQGDPEAFDAVDGLLTIAPNESGGVKNCVEFRDSLYILKSQRTYSTSRDLVNPELPAFWRVISIDEGVGTECFGIASILDTTGPNTDAFIVAAFSGIYLFNGLYNQPEFSWKIDDLWHNIDRSRFDEIQVYNDIVGNQIYVFLPDSTILVAGYRNGLGFQAVRWARWTFPWRITAIGINVEADRAEHLLIAGDGQLWEMDPLKRNDGVEAIHTHVRYAPQAQDTEGAVFNFTSLKLRALGFGDVQVKLFGLDGVNEYPVREIGLTQTPGKEYGRLTNLVSERCAVELELVNASEYIRVQKLTLFAYPLWAERPSDSA